MFTSYSKGLGNGKGDKMNDDVFKTPSSPMPPLYNHGLTEPEVWIEYTRVKKITANGNLTYQGPINFIIPKDVTVRSRVERLTNDLVWEYLM